MARLKSFMKTNLITPEGLDKLKAELDYLWRTERPEITQKVAWAASLGDRSENADYKENKHKLRQIDWKIHHLSKRLEVLKPVPYSPQQEGKVFFGAWITLMNDADEILTFRIVGPDEIYDQKGHISVDSPMARACLGKEEDDEIELLTPEGKKYWYISKILYKN